MVPDRRMGQQHRVLATLLWEFPHNVLRFLELQRMVSSHPQRSKLAETDEQPSLMRALRVVLLVPGFADASPPACSSVRIADLVEARARLFRWWLGSRLWRDRGLVQNTGVGIVAAIRNFWSTPAGILKRSLSSTEGTSSR